MSIMEKQNYDPDLFYYYVNKGRNYQDEKDNFELGNTKKLNPNKKKRKCNKCGKTFMSKNSGNRRCAQCEHALRRSKITDRHLDYVIYLDKKEQTKQRRKDD